MNYSLKDICSRSCMQIKMFADHPEKRPQPNGNVMAGTSFEDQVATQLGDKLYGREMGYFFRVGEDFVYLSNDIITTDGNIIEVKSVSPDRPVADWYLNNSLVQCAIYYTFAKRLPLIKTSKFYVAQTGVSKEIKLPSDFKYYLRFGDKTYKIELVDEDAILGFTLRKIGAVKNWDTAKEWDMVRILWQRPFLIQRIMEYLKIEKDSGCSPN